MPGRPLSPPRFLSALQAVADGLSELGAPWMCIGGVAVIALGVPRFTADVDATVSAQRVDPEAILAALGRHDATPRVDRAVEFARRHQVVLLHHARSGVPIDISLAWLPFETEAIQHARETDFAGVRIRVPRPDDLVVYKLVAARPRDVDDAEKLLAIHGRTLDLPRVRRLLEEFCRALEDPSRLETFERLLRTTGLGT